MTHGATPTRPRKEALLDAGRAGRCLILDRRLRVSPPYYKSAQTTPRGLQGIVGVVIIVIGMLTLDGRCCNSDSNVAPERTRGRELIK